MDYDFVEAARIKAMLSVMEEGFLYHYRRICRWYSQRFYTSLPVVEELPEEQVLQAFFESQFEDMTKTARRKLALQMTETDEETLARKEKENYTSDDAFMERLEKETKKENKKALKKLAEQAKEAAAKMAALADVEIAKPPEPPDISMNFAVDGNLSDEESIAPPPPRKK